VAAAQVKPDCGAVDRGIIKNECGRGGPYALPAGLLDMQAHRGNCGRSVLDDQTSAVLVGRELPQGGTFGSSADPDSDRRVSDGNPGNLGAGGVNEYADPTAPNRTTFDVRTDRGCTKPYPGRAIGDRDGHVVQFSLSGYDIDPPGIRLGHRAVAYHRTGRLPRNDRAPVVAS